MLGRIRTFASAAHRVTLKRTLGASGAHREAVKGPFAAKAVELRDCARLEQKARIGRGS
jgi:hypothetical protein